MSRQRALVLVTTSFPIQGDGSEAAGSFVSDLSEEVAAHVPVRVVAPGRESGTEHWADNVDVFRYAAPERPLSTLKLWRPSDLREIRRVLTAGLEATRRAVAHDAPASHIFALWALPSGHWARRVSAETGVPYSVWTLGSDIWNLGRIPVVRGYLREVLKGARHCFSDGLRLAEDTRIIGGRPVDFLPSSRRIGLRRPAPPRNLPPYRLVFLGRWHPNKGIDLLLGALSLLDDDEWQRIERLDIYGGGPLAPRVAEAVDELRASRRPVVLHGYVTKMDAEAAIAAADYVLIPSRIESIPVVLSDAFKLRRPVICTPVGDMTEITSKYGAGIVADEVGIKAFREAISDALRGVRAFSGSALDEAAEIFDLRRISDRIIQLVEDERT